MLQARIFPCLLLKGEGLVKTVRFKDPTYIGDPINAVRIFNTKEVDELLFLDINAFEERRKPNIELIQKISDECSMPLTVGGGITTVEDIQQLMNAGVEKVSINSAAIGNLGLITNAANSFGSQAIIGAMDVRRRWTGTYEVCTNHGKNNTKLDPVDYAVQLQEAGAGEILLYSIDRDGTMKGFDLELIKKVTQAVSIPVIASGGAGQLEHFAQAIHEGNASAVTAGSFFVFHGRRRAVLINFPTRQEIEGIFDYEHSR